MLHVGEQFTGRKGAYVPLKETIRGFDEIISGKHDGLPEMAFLLTDVIVVFDHLKHTITLLTNIFCDEEPDFEAAYAAAVERLAGKARPGTAFGWQLQCDLVLQAFEALLADFYMHHVKHFAR